MTSLSTVLARYNELREETHTGASAFSAALSTPDPTEKLAYTLIAIGINKELARRGNIAPEDSAKIGAAMCDRVVQQMHGVDGVAELLEYAHQKL